MKTTTFRPNSTSQGSNSPRRPAAWIAALALSTGLLAACGGGEEDSGPANPLVGTWYSSSLDTSWQFAGSSTSSSGSGEIHTRSYDGGSCQMTAVDYTVDASAKTVTYTITRAWMTGDSDYNYDSNVSGFPAGTNLGPFTESFSVSGNTLSIGSGTYASGGQAC